LTGFDLKKLKITFFMVWLVFTMLPARSVFARMIIPTQRLHATVICRLLPSTTSEKEGIVEASSEICPQTISQRNEFKKIFHFNFTTIFQVQALPFTDPELILNNKSFPAIPLYISHCNILI
jgi:hypothetical protein